MGMCFLYAISSTTHFHQNTHFIGLSFPFVHSSTCLIFSPICSLVINIFIILYFHSIQLKLYIILFQTYPPSYHVLLSFCLYVVLTIHTFFTKESVIYLQTLLILFTFFQYKTWFLHIHDVITTTWYTNTHQIH